MLVHGNLSPSQSQNPHVLPHRKPESAHTLTHIRTSILNPTRAFTSSNDVEPKHPSKLITNIPPTPSPSTQPPNRQYAMSDRPSHRGGRGQGSHPRGGRGGGRGGGGAGGAQQERERPKKENILDLGKYMDKQITVKFNGGREVKGTLKGYDALMNLVLDDVHEVVRDDEGNESTRSLGLVVVRGTLLVLVSPVDGSEEIANPFVQAEDD
jgi:U6 snRNA-associated Sm-like protein LSm7